MHNDSFFFKWIIMGCMVLASLDWWPQHCVSMPSRYGSFFGGGGWGFWWVFERKQSWQMLRSQWDLNVPRMRFLLLQIQERGFYFREGFVV